jgi:ketosteroid isomerase-like protein
MSKPRYTSPMNGPRVGAQAILQGARKDLADPAFRITFKSDKVGAFEPGNVGYSKGSFTVQCTDPQTKAPARYSGRYLTLFHKYPDGSWKIVEDMTTPKA